MTERIKAILDAVTDRVFAYRPADKGQQAKKIERRVKRERSVRWAELLLADILGLVHFHLRTGLWPKHKRKGTLKEAPKWTDEARAILVNCRGKDHEQLAIQRAAKWGNPYHE